MAFNNNNVLREQQVTHEDIPVIVDKCVKFVYSHGVMTEGIYRLAGGNTKINRLLTAFRSVFLINVRIMLDRLALIYEIQKMQFCQQE